MGIEPILDKWKSRTQEVNASRIRSKGDVGEDDPQKVLAASMTKFRDLSKKKLALQCKEEQREADAAQVRESALRRRAVTDPYGCPDVTVDL